MDDDSKMFKEGRKVGFKLPVQHRVCQSDIRINRRCVVYIRQLSYVSKQFVCFRPFRFASLQLQCKFLAIIFIDKALFSSNLNSLHGFLVD